MFVNRSATTTLFHRGSLRNSNELVKQCAVSCEIGQRSAMNPIPTFLLARGIVRRARGHRSAVCAPPFILVRPAIRAVLRNTRRRGQSASRPNVSPSQLRSWGHHRRRRSLLRGPARLGDFPAAAPKICRALCPLNICKRGPCFNRCGSQFTLKAATPPNSVHKDAPGEYELASPLLRCKGVDQLLLDS